MALEGVGPSMARGSQLEKGTKADFPMAAKRISRARLQCPELKTISKAPVPVQWWARQAAKISPRSPMR